ncbi:MAG: peptide ABC transporter ATP-binding protein, partial [Actinobacteria bacterium]|nr:peptide ABC transporter ATP-binding protein [Actinomycetota bacterium]
YATEICAEQEPPLIEHVTGGSLPHLAACHHPLSTGQAPAPQPAPSAPAGPAPAGPAPAGP